MPCALILAGAFFYDAIRNTPDLEEEGQHNHAASISTRAFRAPPLAAIQLSQTVEVVEEHQMGEKKRFDDYE